MDDLISRQAAIDALNKMKIYRPLDSDRYVISDCLNKIVNLPSARRNGHWRSYEGTLKCSVCNAEFNKEIMEYCGDDVPRFCPDCGADMRGDEDG